MSMRRKLHLAMGACLVFSVILAGVSGGSAWLSESTIAGLIEEQETTEQMGEVALRGAQALSAERAVIARLVLADRAGMQELERSYQQARTAALEQLANLRRGQGTETQAELAELEALMGNWEQRHRHFWEAAQQGKAEEAAQVMQKEIVSIAEAFMTKGGELARRGQKAEQRAGAEAAGSAHWYLLMALVASAFCVAAGCAGIWITRGGLNELAASLVDMARMAEEVTQAAGSVSNTSQALAVGASQQAASTEETAASATEVKAMAQRNSESASAAAQLVTGAQGKFDQAHQSLTRMEETMSGIEASAGKVARIIKVIDDIAFQTNILSLNAAVEAARAGDAGMGFAVVADEVRGLAQRCATAAQETASLINEAIARSAEGKVVALDVAGTIRSITAETLSIRTLVDEVNAGSEDQARSLDQIAGAIAQIERVTQDSAANAEEAAAASQELTAQAAELRMIAQKLTDLTGAQEGVAVTPKALPAALSRLKPAAAKPAAAKPMSAPAPASMGRFTGRPAAHDSATGQMDDDDMDFRAF